MTMALIQPCLKKLGINLGYSNGERVFPRTVVNRINALFFYNNRFVLIWKVENVKFNQAVKELKNNFKIVDNFITEKNVNSHFKYEFIPKKVDSHLTNLVVYDLETLNTDRVKPYNLTFYRINKIAGRYARHLSLEELKKSINDTLSLVCDTCVGNAL